MVLQYAVKTYVHTKIMNYIQNTNYLDESKIPKKFKHKENLQQLSSNLHHNFLRLEFLIVSNKFPTWIQTENTRNFQIVEEFDHTHSFTGILCYKIFFLEFEKGKNQGVLTWEMHGGPSTTSIVVWM